jgi:transient receptor potential cation channel subfamily M protein 3
MGLLFPPSILLLEFKSREELMQQPQTAAEHADDLSSATTNSRRSSVASLSATSSDDDGAGAAVNVDPSAAAGLNDAELGNVNLTTHRQQKASSTGSIVSLNLASVRWWSD